MYLRWNKYGVWDMAIFLNIKIHSWRKYLYMGLRSAHWPKVTFSIF